MGGAGAGRRPPRMRLHRPWMAAASGGGGEGKCRVFYASANPIYLTDAGFRRTQLLAR